MSDKTYRILIAVIVILMIVVLAIIAFRIYSYVTNPNVVLTMQDRNGVIRYETKHGFDWRFIALILEQGIIQIGALAVVLFLIKKDWTFRKEHSDTH